MYRGFNGGGWAHPGYGFGFPWGAIVMAAIVIGLVVLAVVALRRRGKNGAVVEASASQQGMLILTERFARGEIDSETFRSMKAELESQPGAGSER
jgi:putative membrane protein